MSLSHCALESKRRRRARWPPRRRRRTRWWRRSPLAPRGADDVRTWLSTGGLSVTEESVERYSPDIYSIRLSLIAAGKALVGVLQMPEMNVFAQNEADESEWIRKSGREGVCLITRNLEYLKKGEGEAVLKTVHFEGEMVKIVSKHSKLSQAFNQTWYLSLILLLVQTSFCGQVKFGIWLKHHGKLEAQPNQFSNFIINTTIGVVFKKNATEKSWCLSQIRRF